MKSTSAFLLSFVCFTSLAFAEPTSTKPKENRSSTDAHMPADTIAVSVNIQSGGNMISIPVTNPVPDDSVKHLFPTIRSRAVTFLPPACFTPPNGYAPRDTMHNGSGYWGLFPEATTNTVTGAFRTRDSICSSGFYDVCFCGGNGWSMIGSISCIVDTGTIVSVPPGMRASNWFGYSAGYVVSTQIIPGKAYWVKVRARGKFVLACPPPGPSKIQSSAPGLNELNSLTITDSKGGSQTLYFGADDKNEIELSMFDMPPASPLGVLDARFETAEGGSMVRTHAAKVSEAVEFPVRIQSDAYPVTVSWKMNGGTTSYEMTDGLGGSVFRAKEMDGVGVIKITNSEVNKITVRLVGDGQLPTEYALFQNYPNPFNPNTTIKYGLPVDSRVSMRLYNTLGQEVAALVNEEQKAGYKTVEWNGSDFASGIYFYRLTAGTFRSTKKLVVLK